MLGSHIVHNTHNFQILFSILQPFFTKKPPKCQILYCDRYSHRKQSYIENSKNYNDKKNLEIGTCTKMISWINLS